MKIKKYNEYSKVQEDLGTDKKDIASKYYLGTFPTMTVQELIDELMKVKDKSISIEICDTEGDRFSLLNVDIIYDGEPSVERNVDLNFTSQQYKK